ncbi:MAG: hypothetical protein ABL882_00915 [Sphingopyxis sp.]
MLALIGAQAEATPSVEPESDADIVVLARRLDSWRGRARERNGELECQIIRSSGDRDVDQIGCNAMTICITQLRPTLALHGSERNRTRRRALQIAANQALSNCVRSQRQTQLEALGDRRAGIE